jgi:hypothetical protein
MNIFWWQVPDYWKTYVHEVDEEREMWLNSFYKAPLRLPMPAELEYWWSKGISSPCSIHSIFRRRFTKYYKEYSDSDSW